MQRYFAFSVHKAGSTLFYNLLRGCAALSRTPGCGRPLDFISIPDRLFNAGTPESVMHDPDFVSPVELDRPDTIYGGFRFVPAFLDNRHLDGAGCMVLVRDPRDSLTSLYYSVVKSHVIPPGEAGRAMLMHRDRTSAMTIDQFVLAQARHEDWVGRYRRVTALRNRGKAWRYEDVVYDKARWLDDILAYLKLDLPPERRRQLVQREDVVPATERPTEHVRQVAPGDHRRKLRPETIDELGTVFSEVLDAWGYRQ